MRLFLMLLCAFPAWAMDESKQPTDTVPLNSRFLTEEQMRLCIETGLGTKDNKDVRWFDLAVARGFVTLMQELLPGIDPNEKTHEGYTPLLIACFYDRAECLGVLIPLSDLYAQNSERKNALEICAAQGSSEALAVLFEHWDFSSHAVTPDLFNKSLKPYGKTSVPRMFLSKLEDLKEVYLNFVQKARYSVVDGFKELNKALKQRQMCSEWTTFSVKNDYNGYEQVEVPTTWLKVSSQVARLLRQENKPQISKWTLRVLLHYALTRKTHFDDLKEPTSNMSKVLSELEAANLTVVWAAWFRFMLKKDKHTLECENKKERQERVRNGWGRFRRSEARICICHKTKGVALGILHCFKITSKHDLTDEMTHALEQDNWEFFYPEREVCDE